MSAIVSLVLVVALAAQPTTAPPPSKATGTNAPKANEKKSAKNAAPDPELIGFLGDYEDAADGLDPIGLSEQIADKKTAPASDKKKDGHQP